jgi:hypothetical protein
MKAVQHYSSWNTGWLKLFDVDRLLIAAMACNGFILLEMDFLVVCQEYQKRTQGMKTGKWVQENCTDYGMLLFGIMQSF